MNEMQEKIDIEHYLRVIRKHRWTILTVFAVIFVSVLIFTFTATPIHQATVRLVIEKETPKVTSIQEVLTVDSSGLDYYQTQYKIIESRTVAREVIRRLQLEKNPEFTGSSGGGLLSAIIGGISEAENFVVSLLNTGDAKKSAAGAGEQEVYSPLTNAFIGRIKVSPIRNSRLVDVSFSAKDPVLAAQISNTIAKAYIDKNLEAKLHATQDAVAWLDSQVEQERKKVEGGRAYGRHCGQDVDQRCDQSDEGPARRSGRVRTASAQSLRDAGIADHAGAAE